jgi:hypothetical protein
MGGGRAPLTGAKGFAVIIMAMFGIVGLIWALAAWAATQG